MTTTTRDLILSGDRTAIAQALRLGREGGRLSAWGAARIRLHRGGKHLDCTICGAHVTSWCDDYPMTVRAMDAHGSHACTPTAEQIADALRRYDAEAALHARAVREAEPRVPSDWSFAADAPRDPSRTIAAARKRILDRERARMRRAAA